MKYNKAFGLTAIILIIAGFLVVGGGIYWYIINYQTSGPKNTSTCEMRNDNGICIDDILDFPVNIGNYLLKNYDRSNWEEKCNTVNNIEQCIKSNEIIYLNKEKNLEIHLYPTLITKGDSLQINKTIITMAKEKIKDGIYKIENHEVLWLPETGFNYLIAQYYSIENKTDGTIKYTQKNIDLENEVIKYFINNYPVKDSQI